MTTQPELTDDEIDAITDYHDRKIDLLTDRGNHLEAERHRRKNEEWYAFQRTNDENSPPAMPRTRKSLS